MFEKLFLLMVGTMVLFGCNIQNKMLYFPSAAAPSEASLKADNLKIWEASATDYRGYVAAEDAKHPNGTVIVFHGNGGIAADRAYYLKLLEPLGYRVILAEYPGYGGRKGAVGEKVFVEDGRETLRRAAAQFGEPFFLLGESLGCGVAAAVAKNATAEIAGILLITPWDTLAAIARAKFPFLPVRLVLTDSYDNVSNLAAFAGRIAVVGAGQDEIIPVRHARNLYRSLPGTAKRLWTLEAAGHNDWLSHTTPAWWREVMDYVSRGFTPG